MSNGAFKLPVLSTDVFASRKKKKKDEAEPEA